MHILGRFALLLTTALGISVSLAESFPSTYRVPDSGGHVAVGK